MTEPELPFGIRRSAAHVESAPKIGAVPLVRAVAFYLPQFHPIPANDRAWGEGFTEWHNVTRARPEFTGHHQPRLPANYGYYDLRLPEIQVRQARDASAAGIHAFCYHYYWFDGEQPLLLPLLNHLENPEISLPFCICFANENWTRRWDGLDHDVIFKQTYGDRFAESFWSDAERLLRSEKYLRDEEGRPFLLVYRPSLIPQFKQIAETWRERARAAGLPGLNLIGVGGFENLKAPTAGLDSVCEFPPLNSLAKETYGPPRKKPATYGKHPSSHTNVLDYRQMLLMERIMPDGSGSKDVYPAIMPGWDNVARRPSQGNAFTNTHPALFEEWTRRAVARALRTPHKLLFINAWNEWAEGAYLEPDRTYGWAFLSAFSRGISATPRQDKPENPIAIFVHIHYVEVWDEIRVLIEESVSVPFNLILTTSSANLDIRPPDSAFLQGLELHRLENRGRDILPFLTAMERTKFEFEFALKLHTKRSPHRIDGAEWRRMLIGDLLPSKGCADIVELFKRDPSIGFLSPDEHWVPIREFIGSNREGIRKAAGCLGYDFSEREVETARFIAGSMFWFRKEALRPFVESDIRDLFEPESGQLDGTTAHAIERLFSYIGEANAFVSANVGQVRQLLRRLNGRRYPLQDRMDRFSEYQVHITRKRRIALSPSDDAVSDTGHDEQAEHGRLGVSGGRERIRALARNRLLYGVYERLPWRVRLQIRRVLGLRS